MTATHRSSSTAERHVSVKAKPEADADRFKAIGIRAVRAAAQQIKKPQPEPRQPDEVPPVLREPDDHD
jgi:hypothetical protein